MNIRYLIPVVVVGLVGCEPEPRDISTLMVLNDGVENDFLDGTVFSPEDREPYSGPVFSGEDNWSGRLDDGLLDGPFESYHENGQLWTKGSFSTGRFDGPYESYHPNGQMWGKGSYSNGERDGSREVYYENGQLSQQGSYSNGEKNGPWELYYENGQMREKGSYSNGERCGEWEKIDYQAFYLEVDEKAELLIDEMEGLSQFDAEYVAPYAKLNELLNLRRDIVEYRRPVLPPCPNG